MISPKRFEILNSLPVYGPMYISVTWDGKSMYSEGFPVRFYKTDGTEWVANFQTGVTKLAQVIELEKTSNLLVIAHGACYLMNPDHVQPISAFGGDYREIYSAVNNRFVLEHDTGLSVIEPNGSAWSTQRISWDGIKELSVNSHIVTGLSYDPMNDEWIPFTYDIDTKTLTGGSYHIYENKKPWWKIW